MQISIGNAQNPLQDNGRLDEIICQNFQQFSLFSSIIENFFDGILILTDRGKWVCANSQAQKICKRLIQGISSSQYIPNEIWKICQLFIEIQSKNPQSKILLEAKIAFDNTEELRIRVQDLEIKGVLNHYLIVIIEECDRSCQNVLKLQVKKYGLTAREAEVWRLRQIPCSYREIAEELCVTLNTVKKHIKNIRAKQKATLSKES